MQPHEKLSVWRKSHELTIRVFRATLQFPRDSHPMGPIVRDAALAIPANIADGAMCDEAADFARHLELARCAALRLDAMLKVAQGVGVLDERELAKLEARADEICRMLAALRRTVLRRTQAPGAARTPRDRPTTPRKR